MFRVKDFFDFYNIPYITEGKNSSHGFINVNCCFCDDPSHHLGFKEDGTGFRCWRCDVKGRIIAYPLSILVPSFSYRQLKDSIAKQMVALGAKTWLEEFWQTVENSSTILEDSPLVDMPEPSFAIPAEQRADITQVKKALVYLGQRSIYQFAYLRDHFRAYVATEGKAVGRIVLDLAENGEVLSWVGRDFTGGRLRYLTPSVADGAFRTTDLLFDFDNLKGGDILLVQEGVFDCLKIKVTREPGIDATCLFTKSISRRQVLLLSEVAPRYDHVVIALDAGETLSSIKIFQKLSHLPNVRVLSIVPTGTITDVGALDLDGARNFIVQLRQQVQNDQSSQWKIVLHSR